MKKIKIAFDVHGVISSDPNRYSLLMNELVSSDIFEVWIISGPRKKAVAKELETYGIYEDVHYHQIDTIVEYLLEAGEKHNIKIKNGHEHYFFDETEWNRAKSEICYNNNIHILVDDTDAYSKYFKNIETIFVLKD